MRKRQWLATHKKIVVGGEMDWAPFDFVDETGAYAGLANDYLKIIGEKLGIEVEMITGPPWDELLAMIRRQEIDVLPAIYHSEEREAYVNFTDPLPQDHRIHLRAQRQSNHFQFYGLERQNHRRGKGLYH